MTVYQKLGEYTSMTTPGAANIAPTDLDTSFAGINTVAFVKVVNAGNEPIALSWSTSVLSADFKPTVVGANATEFIQVASASAAPATIYFYASSSNPVSVYITPVAIVGA